MELPHGLYLSAPIDIGADYGGQTRALLMRNRIFVTEAGISPTVLSFSARPDLAERRAVMLERGLLLPQIDTPNIYEHYRERGWDESAETGPRTELADLGRHKTAEEAHADGSPWRVTYRDKQAGSVVHDYLRADGTPYLRIPGFVFKEPSTWPREIQRVGADGSVIGSYPALGRWFRQWVRELTDGERAFLFVDSRFNAQHLVPMRAPNIHLVYMLHNIHVLAPRLWSSTTTDIYGRLLDKVDGMDAMVTLTGRQRDDIALRRGRTNNLFVVPNPVEMPPPAEDHARDPHLVAVVARLEKQKRLTDAIAAFDQVREQVPEARFDIYGDGGERARLQQEIDRRGLGDAVTLKGHDPHAREALSAASAFLVTSSYEGWNLAMQESMSHGCPVVAYDVKYGPREQITDGVNGFLVPEGDQAAMAQRVVSLLRSPDLVRTISDAAYEKARRSKQQFVEDWAHVLHSVVDLKPFRTRLMKVAMEVTELSSGPRRRLPTLRANGSFLGTSTLDGPDEVRLSAVVTVHGRSDRTPLEAVRLSLASVHLPSGTHVELPVTVEQKDHRFELSSSFAAADAVAGSPPGAEMRLRVTLTWANSSWQGYVQRPHTGEQGITVSYSGQGELQLTSPTTSDGGGSDVSG